MKRGEGGLITPFFLACRYERGEGGLYLGIFGGIYRDIWLYLQISAHIYRYLHIFSRIYRGISLERPSLFCKAYSNLHSVQLKNLSLVPRLVECPRYARITLYKGLYRSRQSGWDNTYLSTPPPLCSSTHTDIH